MFIAYPLVSSYTVGIKAAISLSDELFEAADRQAKRAGKSRSQLYAEALEEYLVRHSPGEITEAMNRVVDSLDESIDDFTKAAARRTLERIEW